MELTGLVLYISMEYNIKLLYQNAIIYMRFNLLYLPRVPRVTNKVDWRKMIKVILSYLLADIFTKKFSLIKDFFGILRADVIDIWWAYSWWVCPIMRNGSRPSESLTFSPELFPVSWKPIAKSSKLITVF